MRAIIKKCLWDLESGSTNVSLGPSIHHCFFLISETMTLLARVSHRKTTKEETEDELCGWTHTHILVRFPVKGKNTSICHHKPSPATFDHWFHPRQKTSTKFSRRQFPATKGSPTLEFFIFFPFLKPANKKKVEIFMGF